MKIELRDEIAKVKQFLPKLKVFFLMDRAYVVFATVDGGWMLTGF